MNALALATRGYIVPVSFIDCENVPDITSVLAEKPTMLAANLATVIGPNISGSKIEAPRVASSSKKKYSGSSPSFKGGKTSKPSIKK